MPSPRLFKNNAKSTLASSITSGAATITLASGDGAKFPSPSSGTNIALLTITNAAETVFEDVACTNRSGDTLTVVRGYDGSTAVAWSAGDKIELRITAQFLQSAVTGPDVSASQMSSLDGAKISADSGGSGNTVFGTNAHLFSSGHTYCTAMGQNASRDLSTGDYNTSFGAYAGAYNTTGSYNTSIGYGAGAYTTAATHNTCVGHNAGSLITGVSNTYIGSWTAGTAGSGDNNIVLGYGATKAAANDSNTVTLGNSSIATLRCQATSITALSDRRDKANISPLGIGIEFVNSLNPVEFIWAMRDGSVIGKRDCGFIAQELKEVQEEFRSSDILNLVYEANPDRLEATYGRLIPVMVRAIQDLSARNDAMERRIAELEGK